MNSLVLLLLLLALILNLWYLLFKFIRHIFRNNGPDINSWIPELNFESVAYIIGGIGLSLIVLYSLLPEWLTSLAPEFIGIAVTVLIVERLVKRQNELKRKREVLEQLQSPVRDVAVEALRLTCKNGWLGDARRTDLLSRARFDGANLFKENLAYSSLQSTILKGARLRLVNLQGSNLMWANLDDADLTFTNLRDATLIGASLIGAKLWNARLQNADLRDANLTDAN